MARQQALEERSTGAWSDQITRWMDFVNLYQSQAQRLTSLWVDQTVQIQEESHKLWKEWYDSVGKSGGDWRKGWETSLKTTTSKLRPPRSREAEA